MRKFKRKVINKLYGRSSSEASGSEEDVDISSAVSGSESSPLSGLREESRAQQVRIYGPQCCPKDFNQRGDTGSQTGVLSSGVEESSAGLGDDEASESDSTRRRRKRRHHGSRVPNTNQDQEQTTSSNSTRPPNEPEAGPSQVQTSLTKNQKRKLKKKRREKEKKEARQDSTSEFTFDDLSQNNSSGRNERSCSSEESPDLKSSVCEFLQAVWEVYCLEEHQTDCPGPDTAHLKAVEEYLGQDDPESKEEASLLHHVMTCLVLPGLEQAKEKIKEFQLRTSMNKGCSEFMVKILDYWAVEVMSR
ncbi:uncharacterized protein LOC101853984 isoform X2 [Aplysia californica]|nr:uncharacterized protein LOC101853984 isoform X2 [Aplysia californica]